MRMHGFFLFAVASSVLASPSWSAELRQPTLQAFERYVHDREAAMEREVRGPASSFLWSTAQPGRVQQMRAGAVVTESRTGKDAQAVPDGLIHDWLGAVFLPGASLAQVLALVQDYDRNKEVYKPDVLDSRLLSHRGSDFHIYLRLLKKKVITVVLNTEHDVTYFSLDPTRCYSRSYSTRIAEVENPGKPGEKELPVGQDHGFLWRLNSYWRFQEKDGGVYVECEAISLTRDIPTGLGWMISPIIRNLPKESLENTLRSTRAALVQNARAGHSQQFLEGLRLLSAAPGFGSSVFPAGSGKRKI